MANIIVSPDLGMSLVVRRGIVTVPSEVATVSCRCPKRRGSCGGLLITKLPQEAWTLEKYLRQMADKFLGCMAVRGFYLADGELRLHGPWPSYDFNNTLVDVESALWREAEAKDDPSLILPFVIDRRQATNPYSDYLLVGNFWAKNVLTEIIIEEA